MTVFLFSLFSLLYALLIMVLYKSWGQINSLNAKRLEKSVKVSVLIPVRNEEKGILELLNDIECQDYPKHLFEVIVINDHSTDLTKQIVLEAKGKVSYDLLVVDLDVRDDYVGSHKKSAITQAVAMASGELIINTDGDCRFGAQWVSSFVRVYVEKEAKFISGPVTFKNEISLFEKLQTLEFASLIGVGAGSIQMGMPNMCNGANLAFTKSIFQSVGGYEGISHVHSGDDEFLMHKIYKKYPKGVFFLKDSNAIAHTSAKPNLTALIHQRKRWAGKWKYYTNWNIKLLAMFVFGYNFLFFVAFFSILFGAYAWKIFALQLTLKYISDFVFLKSIMKFLRKPFNFMHFMTIELFYPFYAVFFGIVSNFGKYEWKGRKLKS